MRLVAWSKKGTSTEVEVQPEGINLSILGCLSMYGLIAVSQQVPKLNRRKKQKIAGIKRSFPPTGLTRVIFAVCVRNGNRAE